MIHSSIPKKGCLKGHAPLISDYSAYEAISSLMSPNYRSMHDIYVNYHFFCGYVVTLKLFQFSCLQQNDTAP